jgi:hypothetical protein
MRIAFITAIRGNYEASCKPYAPQTVPCDFLCFTDVSTLTANGWEIDRTPYHLTHPSPLDDGACLNSLHTNTHTFNIAKYYKQAFQNIPRLKAYDIVIWVDGTIQITNRKTAEYIAHLFTSPSTAVVGWEHERRGGSLIAEVKDSQTYERYASTRWGGQEQPRQDVNAQYRACIRDGYDETLWFRIDPARKNLGVWVTCFVAFDMRKSLATEFLTEWYRQLLVESTQDQIGFSIAAQKTTIPYTLPDAVIPGDRPHFETGMYRKHDHGR